MKDKKEAQDASVDLIWIGFKPSDISSYTIEPHHFLPLMNQDFVKISRISKRAALLRENSIVNELELLKQMRSKLEMEALYSYSQCLLREYLAPKMQSAGRPRIDVFDTDGEEMDI
ncbi:hypothetical protein WR25_19651 [Diploscapter pachys]|uniref:Topoisomerase 6 subunit A/Spo11 TOPRIM domain-containing protein n=1 Tax=Diploscapter pachys TaxID=2018661 RepID=A0A2A2LU01_9BILA|nr:hypothetical protein WR25_19651 [Diploscapter pachys]